MSTKRISLLDGFRALAILAVMLFHYTYRWTEPAYTPGMYPYGSFYGNLFAYGFYAVQFFFCISGFVISYTLENTKGFGAFWKNRLIRLLPPMVLCSLITFCLFRMFDNNHLFPNASAASSFLPSLTFTKPELWHLVFPNRQWAFISLSYWSLWVEVQFYMVAAVLFYTNQRTFFRNIVVFALVVNLLNWIPTSFMVDPASYHVPAFLHSTLFKSYYFSQNFNLRFYISWFAIGAFFHHLFMKKTLRFLSLTGIGMLLIFATQFYLCDPWPARTIFLAINLLFIGLVYKNGLLSFLDKPLIRRAGALSYSTYLIHEMLGVLFINKIGPYFGAWSPITPLITILMAFGFAEMSYRVYEKPVTAFLKRCLFKSASLPISSEPAVKEIAPN